MDPDQWIRLQEYYGVPADLVERPASAASQLRVQQKKHFASMLSKDAQAKKRGTASALLLTGEDPVRLSAPSASNFLMLEEPPVRLPMYLTPTEKRRLVHGVRVAKEHLRRLRIRCGQVVMPRSRRISARSTASILSLLQGPTQAALRSTEKAQTEPAADSVSTTYLAEQQVLAAKINELAATLASNSAITVRPTTPFTAIAIIGNVKLPKLKAKVHRCCFLSCAFSFIVYHSSSLLFFMHTCVDASKVRRSVRSIESECLLSDSVFTLVYQGAGGALFDACDRHIGMHEIFSSVAAFRGSDLHGILSHQYKSSLCELLQRSPRIFTAVWLPSDR